LVGLGHYVKRMSRNRGISAVLIANNDDDDKANMAMPTTVIDTDRTDKLSPVDLGQFGPGYGRAWHVSGGYDPLELYERGSHADPGAVGAILDGARNLALSCRGAPELDPATGRPVEDGASASRVPVVAFPHGLLNDGGSAFLLSSYVLATRDTCFRLLNPSRGLSLDPTGLSFVLPRAGWEYDQISAEYSSSIAVIAALCNYELDAEDLLETGLATHMMREASRLGPLEFGLGELDPFDAQIVKRKKVHTMDEREEMRDRNLDLPEDLNNAPYKGRNVANLIGNMCEYDAAGTDIMSGNGDLRATTAVDAPGSGRMGLQRDPSLYPEDEDVVVKRSSRVVDLAATFDPILKMGRTVDVLEGLREVASSHRSKSDPEERECGEVARELADGMESQSPLAVRVIHRLLQLGAGRSETLEGCMEREGRAQRNMFTQDDFKFWAEAASKGKVEEIGEFKGWKHRGVGDVTDDEVEEIIGAE